jgi:hypothetical protein
MRSAAMALGILGAAACGSEPPPNPFPAEAQSAFLQVCSGGEAYCACSWDKITRQFTAEDWEEAQAALVATGHPDPRIVVIANACREVTL